MSKIDSNGLTAKSEALDATDVADYLRQNPEFFTQHAALLADLELAHECGQATSLIERQAQVMRHKIQSYETRLSDILTTARRNDVQFEKTKRLVIELAAATNLNDLTQALKHSFTNEFQSDALHLVLFSGLQAEDDHADLSSAQNLDDSADYAEIQALAAKNWAYCQAFKGAAMVQLFSDHELLKSSAIVPLYLANKPLGVLIIASKSADYYTEQLDTLFLNHVATVISRCLGRF